MDTKIKPEDKYVDIKSMSQESKENVHQFAVQRSIDMSRGEEKADRQEVNIYQSIMDETLEVVDKYQTIKEHVYNEIDSFECMLREWDLGIVVNLQLPSKKTISFNNGGDKWKLTCNASDWRTYPLSVMKEIVENFDKFLYAVQRAIGEEMGECDEDH